MKFTVSFLCMPALLCAGPALTDEQLLEKVRTRTTSMEQITPAPQLMPGRAALLCDARAALAEQTKEDRNPHIRKFSLLYADKAGRAAAEGREPQYPEGTVLVKEKLPSIGGQPGAESELFTGMLKREKGFNPECGDWEFFTVSGDAQKITSRGRLDNCMECHRDYAAQDFTSRELVPPRIQQPAADGSITLHSRDAYVFGEKLRYEPQPNKNTLGFWTRKEDVAEWLFAVPAAGDYELEVLQGCGKGSGGAEVKLETPDPGNGLVPPDLKFTVEDTGHFQNFKPRVIGRVSLPPGARLSLKVVPLTKPGVAVMDLRQVVLKPVKRN